ncbi:MAG TPA: alpha/beta hydrolase [Thiobacillaceae bacterium]|nr:alpha/beta hydrolase [Thiobacillaceae bacterium]
MSTSLSRKRFLQGSAAAVAAALVAPRSAVANFAAASTGNRAMQLTQSWDKTFPKSAKVDHRKVTFRNRYGITLAADLYVPNGATGRKLAALAVCGPFGAVKEQSSGFYAQTMAERGYVTVAFDPSFTGESGGEPRHVASPDINTEDVSAAVDFLGLQPVVDRERIGVIGICGWGGIALNAVAVDKRIKAVVASTMYDMSRVMSKGYNDTVTPAQRAQTLEQLGQQRWKDAEIGAPEMLPMFNVLKGGEPQFMVDYADYYKSKQRGFHPRAINSNGSWTVTSGLSFMNAPLMTHIAEISPRPILFIHGENAHSRYFSETAYAAAAQPKELMIIKDASHVDLYDRLDKIPFDAIAGFFGKNLKASA